MKTVLTTLVAVLFASQSFAAAYKCNVVGTAGQAPLAAFELDTELAPNKSIDLTPDTSVGCVTLKTTPAYISCAFVYQKDQIAAAATEVGSLLTLVVRKQDKQLVLSCQLVK